MHRCLSTEIWPKFNFRSNRTDSSSYSANKSPFCKFFWNTLETNWQHYETNNYLRNIRNRKTFQTTIDIVKTFFQDFFRILGTNLGKRNRQNYDFCVMCRQIDNLLSPAKAPLINRRSTISIDVSSPPLPSPLFIFPLVLARSREGLSLHVHRGTNLGRARLVPLSPSPPQLVVRL